MTTAIRQREEAGHESRDEKAARQGLGRPDTDKRAPTPWPGGRRRNWRAAFMLAGAALAMSALLALWSWLTA